MSTRVTQVVFPSLGELVFEGEECDTEEATQLPTVTSETQPDLQASRAAALRVCLEVFAAAGDVAPELKAVGCGICGGFVVPASLYRTISGKKRVG